MTDYTYVLHKFALHYKYIDLVHCNMSHWFMLQTYAEP